MSSVSIITYELLVKSCEEKKTTLVRNITLIILWKQSSKNENGLTNMGLAMSAATLVLAGFSPLF